MKMTTPLTLATALTLLALSPVALADDDELEVTMEIMVNEDDLNDDINEMRGPGEEEFEDDGDDETDADDLALNEEERERLEAEFAGIEDDFEHDDVDEDQDADIDEEDDFEEDETVDDDEFEEDLEDDSDDMEEPGDESDA